MLVLPQLLAGLGVQCIDTRVRRSDEHAAVMDQRLRFLSALLFAAEREGPGRHEARHGLGVDLRKRREALALRAHAPRQHVVGRLAVVVDHGVGDVARLCGERRAERGEYGKSDQSVFHLVSPIVKNEPAPSPASCCYRAQARAACCASCSHSSSLNRRERVKKRFPVPFSSENMPPMPSTTSMISCVCFQYSN